MKLWLETLLTLGQNAVNYALSFDPHTQDALLELQNRCIAVHILSIKKTIYVQIVDQHIFFNTRGVGAVDVSITAKAQDLWHLSKKAATPQHHIEIQGNMHIAQKFSQILHDFHPDWEEALSHVLGDVAGHALAQSLRQAHVFAKQVASNIMRQTADYFVDENPQIAAKASIDAFIEEVDHARVKCDRLLVRVRLLQQRVNPSC